MGFYRDSLESLPDLIPHVIKQAILPSTHAPARPGHEKRAFKRKSKVSRVLAVAKKSFTE